MVFSEYLPYYKRNLWLAFPVVLSQIGQVTVFLVDNMMVGHVGTAELAASSFANNIFMLGMYLGMGITYGLTPLVGREFGNGNLQKTTELLKNGIFAHLSSGFILALVMMAIYFFLPLMGQTSEVVARAKPYYLWLCYSFLPFILFYSFKQFFEGIGNTRIAMAITLAANIINIVVNYVLIFGKFGFPALGLVGAGIGTFVARLSMPLLFIIYVAGKARYNRYFKLAYTKALKVKEVLVVLKLGIPIGSQIMVEVMAFGLGAIMMGWLGEIPLAAHQVAIGLASFTYMVSFGVSSATTIRVSHQVGRNDYGSVKKAAYASTHLVLFFMSVMAALFVVLRNQLPLLFTNDPNVISIASGLLIIAALFQVFDGLQVVMLGALRGMSDVKLPMVFAFISYILIGIPLSYAFAFPLGVGPKGIWLGFLFGLGIAGFMFYFRFRRNLKKRQ